MRVLAIQELRLDVECADDDEEHEDREGWESISMDGHQVGVKTSALEDKCQAFETLLIHASTLNARFGPYVSQVLELALPGLRFYIHDVVQEACAMYVRWQLVLEDLLTSDTGL